MIQLAELRSLHTSCPTQWEGMTSGGSPVSIRYRWGLLTIDVDGEQVFSRQCGDSYDGTLHDSDLRRFAPPWIAFPEDTSIVKTH